MRGRTKVVQSTKRWKIIKKRRKNKTVFLLEIITFFSLDYRIYIEPIISLFGCNFIDVSSERKFPSRFFSVIWKFKTKSEIDNLVAIAELKGLFSFEI